MINGFKKETDELNQYEREVLLPLVVSGLLYFYRKTGV